MEFHLFDKVMIIKDVKFENKSRYGIIVPKGTVGVIVDITTSIYDEKEKGYTIELPEFSEFDPTFTFSADCLELISQ